MDRPRSSTNSPGVVETFSAAAYEVVDLTENSSPKAGATKHTAATRKGLTNNINIVDLTTADNPCYDPAEIEHRHDSQRQSTPGRRNPKSNSPGTITWDKVYPKLPKSVQQQLEHDKPKLGSSDTAQNKRATPTNAPTTSKMNPDDDEDEYGDFFLDQEAELLIEIADRVSSQVSSKATAGRSSTPTSSEPCPVCKKGKRIRTTFQQTGSPQTGHRCTDKNCRYKEFDY
ncbi:hypothetical protein QBC37DRAFT_166819 [Rhypophila decipiens]|uniref:Uncharacterized protein n=1 Tax=Rhypophila decipiens TaxID=261697 RepID=A0AAN7BF80_9PEZI|nr:hypothetical protein QBC37DRAFT_166819 [Rhypophila decipiens]